MFRFGVPRLERVTLGLYDTQGRRVRRLLDAEVAPGEHAVVWDGRDEAGRIVASAVYFSRLECDGMARVAEVVEVK